MSTQEQFTLLDETLGLSAFAEEVLAIAHTLIQDEVLKLMVRRDLAAVRIFSAKIHARMTDMQAETRESLLARSAEPIGTTCLPMKELREDHGLAAWCSSSETALERCLEIAVTNQLSADVEKLFRKQLVRILRRRARIESWISRHPAPPSSATGLPIEPHVLLVRLSATQGAAMEREFLLRHIPCVIANGTGEAMFRIVRRRPLMVLMNAAMAGDTKAITDELEKRDPAVPGVPVVSVVTETSNESMATSVQDALGGISDAAARFARGRTN